MTMVATRFPVVMAPICIKPAAMPISCVKRRGQGDGDADCCNSENTTKGKFNHVSAPCDILQYAESNSRTAGMLIQLIIDFCNILLVQSHFSADFLTENVDGKQLPLTFKMPIGPAVARRCILNMCTNLVDRA